MVSVLFKQHLRRQLLIRIFRSEGALYLLQRLFKTRGDKQTSRHRTFPEILRVFARNT